MSTAPEPFLSKGIVDLQLKFGKITFDDIRRWEAPIERECFVEGLFARGELAAIYGNPKDGKSHGITYLLYRASLGLSSFGLDVVPCRVVYLALEGGNGFRNRVLALKRRFGESDGFFPMRQPLNFLEDAEAVRDLIAGLRALKADVLVVDTVTRALPGGGMNDGQDFSKLVGIMDGIRNETGVCAVLVHHAGASGRMMGSTVLPGALDVLARVQHDEVTGVRTLKVEDARDDETGREIAYRIEGYELGTNSKGKPIKTGIVVECDETATAKKAVTGGKLSDKQRLRFQRITEMFACDPCDFTESVIPAPGMPRVICVRREDVRREFQKAGWLEGKPTEPTTAQIRGKLRDILEALQAKGRVCANAEWVWLP